MKAMRNCPAPLAVDFGQARRRSGWLGWLTLALGVLALAGVLFEVRGDYVDLDERAAIIERLRRQLRASQSMEVSPVSAQAAYAIGPATVVAAQLNVDWAGVFAGIARAQGAEVRLREIHVDAPRGGLRLVAEAPSLEVAFAYIGLLQGQGSLRSPMLDSYAWTDEGGRQMVRFTASAAWGAGQ